MAKVNIGKMPCETCGNAVTVKQNENGTLSYRCDECDAAPYAKTGTLQNEVWRGKMTGLSTKNDAHSEAIPDLKHEVKAKTLPEKEHKPAPRVDMWGNLA